LLGANKNPLLGRVEVPLLPPSFKFKHWERKNNEKRVAFTYMVLAHRFFNKIVV